MRNRLELLVQDGKGRNKGNEWLEGAFFITIKFFLASG